jgi:hypothetical protein
MTECTCARHRAYCSSLLPRPAASRRVVGGWPRTLDCHSSARIYLRRPSSTRSTGDAHVSHLRPGHSPVHRGKSGTQLSRLRRRSREIRWYRAQLGNAYLASTYRNITRARLGGQPPVFTIRARARRPIKLRGSTVQEILTNPATARRFTGREMSYLERYAYEYGYTRVGETWTKTGPWRASTAGRGVGAAVGPAGELVTSPDR